MKISKIGTYIVYSTTKLIETGSNELRINMTSAEHAFTIDDEQKGRT